MVGKGGAEMCFGYQVIRKRGDEKGLVPTLSVSWPTGEVQQLLDKCGQV